MKIETIDALRLFLGRKLPAPIFKILFFFRIIYKNIRMPEQKRTFGNLHPDKTFYVIRLYPPATGWLANYNYVLGYIKHAQERGLIPIVDMEHYATLYTEKEIINGTKNVWEYFFTQPSSPTGSSYTLEEVYKSKNVILSNGSMPFFRMVPPDKEIMNWQMKISQLVPFNSVMRSYVEKELKQILPPNKRILGIAVRGSDLKQRLIGHHIQITAEELLPIVKQKIIDWKIDHVYIVTEDKNTIDFFSTNLSNIIFRDIKRLENINKNTSAMVSNSNKIGKYTSLVNYQTDIYILSQCTCLLGTLSNGLYTALIWNNAQAEHIEIIDKGKYR